MLQKRLDNPFGTLRELASIIGYSKDKVSRVIARCDAKVRQECPDLSHYVSYYSTGKKNRASGFSSFKTDTVTSEIIEGTEVLETLKLKSWLSPSEQGNSPHQNIVINHSYAGFDLSNEAWAAYRKVKQKVLNNISFRMDPRPYPCNRTTWRLGKWTVSVWR